MFQETKNEKQRKKGAEKIKPIQTQNETETLIPNHDHEKETRNRREVRQERRTTPTIPAKATPTASPISQDARQGFQFCRSTFQPV